jgi:glycosyltransferase involved in cell wall biosynthesis
MPSVVLLRSSLHFGGVERQLLDHARRLRRNGWDVQLFALFRGGGEHPLAQAAAAAQIPAFTIADPGPWSLSPLRQLRSRLAALSPTLIHTCDYRSDVLAYLSQRGRPQLAESHGRTEEDRAMKLWNHIDGRVLRRLPAVVAVSAAWETALAATGMSPGRLHVVGNSAAVLAQDPPPSPAPLSSSGPHLLYAGRISPEKGLDVPLQAWSEIRRIYPDAQFWVLGTTSPGSSYQRRIGPLLEQPGIHALDRQPDIRPWLLAVDAVIVPSRREAWGMTAFEALCAGAPLLATRVGGLPALCRNAPHAHLVSPDDPAALIDGLRLLLAHDFPRGASLGQAYRSQPRFDPNLRHQRLLRVYQALI